MSSCSECCLGGSEPHRASLSSESSSTAIFSRSAAKSEFENFQKFSEIACKRFSRLTFKFGRFWSYKFYKQWPENLFEFFIVSYIRNSRYWDALVRDWYLKIPTKFWAWVPKIRIPDSGFLYPEILGPKSPWFGFLGSWNFHFRDSGF